MVEQAKPERSDPNPSAVSGGEEKVSSAEAFEDEPEMKVSEEALRGPKTPAPRAEYEFEKEMDGKGGGNQASAGESS